MANNYVLNATVDVFEQIIVYESEKKNQNKENGLET